jgi:hypothetical protein
MRSLIVRLDHYKLQEEFPQEENSMQYPKQKFNDSSDRIFVHTNTAPAMATLRVLVPSGN